MDGNLEPLEKIFRHLEEESQRRAEELSRLETKVPALGDTPERPASALAVKRLREKRRGSISISRIGQLAEDEVAEFDTRGPTTPLPLMKIASDSPFYQAQIANDSTDSIASGASAHSDDHAHAEDDNHVTQMHHIAGKQSISAKMLPRRLSRSQSASVIPSRGVQNIEPTVIIDVSVQEATVESDTDDGPVVVRSRRTSIKAAGTLRHQSSMASIPAPKLQLPSPNWLAKAKKFTLKLTRRNRPSISVEQYES